MEEKERDLDQYAWAGAAKKCYDTFPQRNVMPEVPVPTDTETITEYLDRVYAVKPEIKLSRVGRFFLSTIRCLITAKTEKAYFSSVLNTFVETTAESLKEHHDNIRRQTECN